MTVEISSDEDEKRKDRERKKKKKSTKTTDKQRKTSVKEKRGNDRSPVDTLSHFDQNKESINKERKKTENKSDKKRKPEEERRSKRKKKKKSNNAEKKEESSTDEEANGGSIDLMQDEDGLGSAEEDEKYESDFVVGNEEEDITPASPDLLDRVDSSSLEGSQDRTGTLLFKKDNSKEENINENANENENEKKRKKKKYRKRALVIRDGDDCQEIVDVDKEDNEKNENGKSENLFEIDLDEETNGVTVIPSCRLLPNGEKEIELVPSIPVRDIVEMESRAEEMIKREKTVKEKIQNQRFEMAEHARKQSEEVVLTLEELRESMKIAQQKGRPVMVVQQEMLEKKRSTVKQKLPMFTYTLAKVTKGSEDEKYFANGYSLSELEGKKNDKTGQVLFRNDEVSARYEKMDNVKGDLVRIYFNCTTKCFTSFSRSACEKKTISVHVTFYRNKLSKLVYDLEFENGESKRKMLPCEFDKIIDAFKIVTEEILARIQWKDAKYGKVKWRTMMEKGWETAKKFSVHLHGVNVVFEDIETEYAFVLHVYYVILSDARFSDVHWAFDVEHAGNNKILDVNIYRHHKSLRVPYVYKIDGSDNGKPVRRLVCRSETDKNVYMEDFDDEIFTECIVQDMTSMFNDGIKTETESRNGNGARKDIGGKHIVVEKEREKHIFVVKSYMSTPAENARMTINMVRGLSNGRKDNVNYIIFDCYEQLKKNGSSSGKLKLPLSVNNEEKKKFELLLDEAIRYSCPVLSGVKDKPMVKCCTSVVKYRQSDENLVYFLDFHCDFCPRRGDVEEHKNHTKILIMQVYASRPHSPSLMINCSSPSCEQIFGKRSFRILEHETSTKLSDFFSDMLDDARDNKLGINSKFKSNSKSKSEPKPNQIRK